MSKRKVKIEVTMVGTVEVEMTDDEIEEVADGIPCAPESLPKSVQAQLDFRKIVDEMDCEVTDVIEQDGSEASDD